MLQLSVCVRGGGRVWVGLYAPAYPSLTILRPRVTFLGCLGFTWASSPACTELEIIVMNWLGKMIGLPKEFLHADDQKLGGGVIQTTASECTLVGYHSTDPSICSSVRALLNALW